MDTVSFFLLFSSVMLSSGRNILSKNLSNAVFGTKKFFSLQTAIFCVGALILLILSIGTHFTLSPLTLLLALFYGIFLLSAQWNYTVALKNGKTGICSTVYSLGFVLPTVFGVIFYKEYLGVFDVIGLITVFPAIILAGTRGKNASAENNKYFLPLIIAMFSSGGLGILQKVQQNSPYPDEKVLFMLSAFALAAAVSFIFCLFVKSDGNKLFDKKIFSASGVGVAFACCNLLNTALAGRLDSIVFFPILNIETILVSIIFGMIFFKERFTKRDLIIFILGIAAILLISVG